MTPRQPDLPEPLVLEWDEAKNARNVAERGLPFALAEVLLQNPATWMLPDLQHSATEARWWVYGSVDMGQGPRLLLAVVTIRDRHVRVISLRRAKRREVQAYEQHRREATG